MSAGLLAYLTLMAADILNHKAVKVPVGEDQEQNREMARRFARRFNSTYGVDFFYSSPQLAAFFLSYLIHSFCFLSTFRVSRIAVFYSLSPMEKV